MIQAAIAGDIEIFQMIFKAGNHYFSDAGQICFSKFHRNIVISNTFGAVFYYGNF